MRTIRIYTPQFQALIDTYINEGIEALQTHLEGFEQPMNEEIRAYARAYISPVKVVYKDLDEAMKVWDTDV